MWIALLCFAIALLAHLLVLKFSQHFTQHLETILILASRAWLTTGLIFAPWSLKGVAVAALLLMPACLRVDRESSGSSPPRCPQSCEAFRICHQEH